MKLSENQKRFIKYMIPLVAAIYQNTDDNISGMLQDQKENRDELLNKISKILLTYTIVDSILKVTMKDKKKLNTSLGTYINKSMSKELKRERELTEKTIRAAAKDRWGINSYLFSFQTDFKLSKLDPKKVDKIVKKTIDGKNYSDRMGDNKNKVAKILQNKIGDFLEGKISVNDIEKEIKTIYNTNAYNITRLVDHEVARVQAEVNEVWLKENKTEYVMYDATLDKKTCKICGGYDGKVYLRESERPNMPQHVSCRCEYVALPDKDWRPKERMDNETKNIINYKNYKEWAKENNSNL